MCTLFGVRKHKDTITFSQLSTFFFFLYVFWVLYIQIYILYVRKHSYSFIWRMEMERCWNYRSLIINDYIFKLNRHIHTQDIQSTNKTLAKNIFYFFRCALLLMCQRNSNNILLNTIYYFRSMVKHKKYM